jgi:hypothetical protein
MEVWGESEMRKRLTLIVPISLAVLCTAGPVMGQSRATRDVFLPRYNANLEQLEKELEAIAELQSSLEQETDLIRGCGTLNDSLAHHKTAETLLVEMEDYAKKMRMDRERKASQEQLDTIQADIELKEGDIERMCSNLPE